MVAAEIDAWLARLRHDLVKRFLWPARDRRDAGGAPAPGELLPDVIDEEGRPVAAGTLWAELKAEAPPGGAAGALEAFEEAVGRAAAAAAAGDVDGVLALDADFEALARSLERGG